MNVTERLLRYVSFDTQSENGIEQVPSTSKQFVLADELAREMEAVGISGVTRSEHGYVYGFIPANCESAVSLGFVAHMDTATEASGANVRPRLIENYPGGDIVLESGDIISPAITKNLDTYVGQDLIVTDGTTLLGADDKAGIAEIMSMAERLLADPSIRHGRIAIAFTPDEEVGNGTAYFDLAQFGANYAYTVDGGTVGELEYENFNAASAFVKVRGVGIHPGSAKNVMKNALTIGMEFDRLLPHEQRPEFTEGYEGFFHLLSMQGATVGAELNYLIREHDAVLFEEKKELMRAAAAYINAKYGDVLDLKIEESYRNMKEKILPHMHLIATAKAAFIGCDVEPKEVPIRGGTDGAMLSYKGLPCPNLSTGGENFHGIREFISIQAMEKMVDVLTEIVRLTYEN